LCVLVDAHAPTRQFRVGDKASWHLEFLF